MKKFLALIVLFVPFLSIAQSNFQPGYVVNIQGDTIKGYIDYKERSTSPSNFKFKSTAGEVTKYDLSNSLAFGVNDLESYQRFVVDVSMSKEYLALLSYGLDTSSIRDTVFLKVLQTGKNVTLYAYKNIDKQRFYILEKTNLIPVELKRYIYYNLEGSPGAVTDNKYIKQLYAIKQKLDLTAIPDERKWKQMRYVESDLIAAAADINEQEITKSKLPSTRFFIGAGLNKSEATYSGEHLYTGDGATAKGSYLPFFNFGVDLFANPAIKKIIYRVEISLMRGIYTATTTRKTGTTLNLYTHTFEHKFNQYTAQLTPQMIINLYNTNKFKYFLSGGMSMNYSYYDKNSTTTNSSSSYYGSTTEVKENPIKFSPIYFSPRINTGIVINNKLELSAGYQLPSATTQYFNYSVDLRRFSLGLNWMLGKN